MPVCCAINCNNRAVKGSGISFYPFPLNDKIRLKKWTDNLRRKGFKPTEHSRICSDHFTEEDFIYAYGTHGRRSLKPDCVPSVFKFTPSSASTSRPPTASTSSGSSSGNTRKRSLIAKKEKLQRAQLCDSLIQQKNVDNKTSSPDRNISLQDEQASVSASSKRAHSTSSSDSVEISSSDQPVSVDLPYQPIDIASVKSRQKTKIPRPSYHRRSPRKQYRDSKVTKSVACDTRDLMVKKDQFALVKPETRCIGTSTQPSLASTVVQTDISLPLPSLSISSVQEQLSAISVDHPYHSSRDNIIQQPPIEHSEVIITSSPFKIPSEMESMPPQVTPIKKLASPDETLSEVSSLPSETEEEKQVSVSMYEPSNNESTDSSSVGAKNNYSSQKKYIVFSDNLLKLFKFCFECGSLVETFELSTRGTELIVNIRCSNKHSATWHSMPTINHFAAGNVLMAAASLFTGANWSRIEQFMQFANVAFLGHTAYYNIQEKILFPVVMKTWRKERNDTIEHLQKEDRDLTMCGDARCDTPGHSAKYGTYTMMESVSGKIVDYEVVHVTEVTNSNNMEPKGFDITLSRLLEELSIRCVVTDRHVTINMFMNTVYSWLVHQFDVWHLVKNLVKKLNAKAKKKKYRDLAPWIQSIANHLWWCSQTCKGNPDLLIEKWTSIVHHVCNEHSWSANKLYHKCSHPPYTRQEIKEKKWMKRESPEFQALQEIVFKKVMLTAIRKLSEYCHTGQLEAYHSLYNKYMPKRTHFGYPGMIARTALACLDHNNNVGRSQRTYMSGKDKGKEKFNVVFSKAKKDWVAKPLYEDKDYTYVGKMFDDVFARCSEKNLEPENFKKMPKNISRGEKPNKEDIIEKHTSRFQKL